MPVKVIGQPTTEYRTVVKTGTDPLELLEIGRTGVALSSDVLDVLNRLEERDKKRQAEAIRDLRNVLVSEGTTDPSILFREEFIDDIAKALKKPEKYVKMKFEEAKKQGKVPESLALELKAVLGLTQPAGLPYPILSEEMVKPSTALEVASLGEMKIPTPSGTVLTKPAGISPSEFGYIAQTYTPYYKNVILSQEDVDKLGVNDEIKKFLEVFTKLKIPVNDKTILGLIRLPLEYLKELNQIVDKDRVILTKIKDEIDENSHYAHLDEISRWDLAFEEFYRQLNRFPEGTSENIRRKVLSRMGGQQIDLKKTLTAPVEQKSQYEVSPSTGVPDLDFMKKVEEYIIEEKKRKK
jgi:hypothetical protein